MAHEFRLPDIGEGLTEAEIVRWLVGEGEYVAADQPLVEVETDKAVVEIPSPYAGTVLSHGGAAGDVLEVGAVLVVVGDPDGVSSPSTEEPPTLPPETAQLGEAQAGESQIAGSGVEEAQFDVVASVPSGSSAAPIVGTLSEDAELLAPRIPGGQSTGNVIKALPIVRKLARDNGVDLADIQGSGPEGRITRDDVLEAIQESQAPTPAQSVSEPIPSPTPESPAPVSGERRERMSRLRRTIAANMAKSWAEIPHVTTFDDVDATRLLEARSALALRHDRKIPLEALVVKAVIPALDSFPEFNASIDDDELVVHGTKDVGIAVDTPDGLLVAVIRDAESKSVLELAAEVVRLGEGAKGRTLAPDELVGQTFTVSNIGAVGGGHGTPIVPYGTTAILSVGRAKEKPIVEAGDLLIAPMMPLSLSYDHRVVDGGQGRRFMALVMENLEEPALFLAT